MQFTFNQSNKEEEMKRAFEECIAFQKYKFLQEKREFINYFETDEDSDGSGSDSFQKKNPFGKGPGIRGGIKSFGGKKPSPSKPKSGKHKSIISNSFIGETRQKMNNHLDSGREYLFNLLSNLGVNPI